MEIEWTPDPNRLQGVDTFLVGYFDEVETAVRALHRATNDYKAGRINSGDLVGIWMEEEEALHGTLDFAWADLSGPWMGVTKARKQLEEQE